MTALLLTALLAAAPGCPEATAAAARLGDEELARRAPALLAHLATAAGASASTGALQAEVARAEAAAGPGDARAAAGARLRAALLRHCALAAAPRLAGAGEAERRLAAEILDRPEYRRARADPEVLRRLLRDLWARIQALLETGEAQRFAGFSRALFLGAAAAAGVLWLWALRRGRASPRVRAPALVEPAPVQPRDPGLEAARQAAARGDGSAAVRLAFLAALAVLERDQAVPPGRALTNGELVALLGRRGRTSRGPLEALAGLFDRAVYGGRPAGAAEAAAAIEAARELGAGREA